VFTLITDKLRRQWLWHLYFLISVA